MIESHGLIRHPVLILGNQPRVSLAIARSLHRRGIDVDLAALATDTPRLRSRAVRRSLVLSGDAEHPDEFHGAISQIIDKNKYDMLIPASDTALALVSGCYNTLQDRLHIACPAPPIVKRVLDKDVTLCIARACGITAPRSFSFVDEAGLEAMRDSLSFPVVAKDRSKSLMHRSSFKVRYFGGFEELRAALRAEPDFGSRVLLQEYCHGVGVGIAVLVRQGRAIAAFQHRRLREYPYTGGVAVSAVAESLDPLLLRSALELLGAIGWEGVAMVEFRRDLSTGRTVLMEVNGRYWGTCSFAVACGIDFPFFDWQLAHGELPAVPETYPVGLTWRWTAGYINRIHGLLVDPASGHIPRPSPWRELVGAVLDFGPMTCSALWSIKDPIPELSELGRTMTSLAAADTKRVLRRAVPRRLRDHLRVSRSLGKDGGRVYLEFALARALGFRKGVPTPAMLASARSILFICHGNIIRSAMAAALLRKHLEGRSRGSVRIASAGLCPKPGRGADERALIAARELSISLEDHRSRLLTVEMVADADLIFVMDYQNEARLLARFPEAGHKVFLLGGKGNDRRVRGREVADPYEGGLDDVRRCLAVLDSLVRDLLPRLRPSRDEVQHAGMQPVRAHAE